MSHCILQFSIGTCYRYTKENFSNKFKMHILFPVPLSTLARSLIFSSVVALMGGCVHMQPGEESIARLLKQRREATTKKPASMPIVSNLRCTPVDLTYMCEFHATSEADDQPLELTLFVEKKADTWGLVSLN
jgi:hypothetical protein